MKQFNLDEYLKNPGRKIVTRDGHKARVICTDRNVDDYIVIALVQETLGEDIYSYTKEGLLRDHPSVVWSCSRCSEFGGWIANGNLGFAHGNFLYVSGLSVPLVLYDSII